MIINEPSEDFIIKTTYPSHDWYIDKQYKINKSNQVYSVDYRLGSWFISMSEYDPHLETWSEMKQFEGYVSNIVNFFAYAWGRISNMKNFWNNDATMNEYAKVISLAMELRKTAIKETEKALNGNE